jgi:D-threonate/D-erythronate kinase
MLELAIIADDLTGALDAAAPFAGRGIATAVALGPAGLPKAVASGARVVSVSTDSREIAPEVATAAVRQALAALPASVPIFKKVDSRLKGNVASELDALPHGRSLVVPAIPDFGRVTVGGFIRGFGVSEPIDIAARLGHHAKKALIPDISVSEDIDECLDGSFDLLVGARGLAEAVARRMAPVALSPPAVPGGGDAFCVIGSTDPITLEQVEQLRRANTALTAIAAPNGAMPPFAKKSRLTLLQAVPGSGPADGKAVAQALGKSLATLSPAPGDLLVLSGGATAQVILQSLGIETLDLLGEVQPGLPMARAGDLTVVTKSGGFGEPDCLSRLFAPFASAMNPVSSHVG